MKASQGVGSSLMMHWDLFPGVGKYNLEKTMEGKS